MDTKTRTREPNKFFNYPQPKRGPSITYSQSKRSNPILRGLLLRIAAYIVPALSFIQRLLWANAGLSDLQKIRELDGYEPRYDPTVVPLPDPTFKSSTVDLPSIPTDPLLSENTSSGPYRSIHDYHIAYRDGKLTPSVVADRLLEEIQRTSLPYGTHSSAFLESRKSLVREAAAASTKRYQNGKELGLLDGIPVAVKDDVFVTGYRKTFGSSRDFGKEGEETSWCVRKWEEAGAIMIGKTNMHELGLDSTNNNPIHGTPRNPYNKHYYPGGSSGGSAYAVAAGLVPIALGTDAGGSIRIPASYCGVYGLKPSHNRVSCRPSLNICPTLNVVGPLACTIADLEVAYRVMALPDPRSPMSLLFAVPGRHEGNRRKILGLDSRWFSRATGPVLWICQRAIDYYSQVLGYQVIDITIPLLSEGQMAHNITILSEVVTSLHGNNKGLCAPNKLIVAVGSQSLTKDFILAQKLRNLLQQHLAYLFSKYPGLIIVTPTVPTVGWHITKGEKDLRYGISDEDQTKRAGEYCYFANLTGLPALSIPVGYGDPVEGSGKIPVGLMGTGEWGSEDDLIEWGRDGETYLNQVLAEGRMKPVKWEDNLRP